MSNRKSNITLIGFSATGKSSVAEKVADRLGWAVFDIDSEIEKRSGKTIAELFKQEGESKFRERERNILKQVCREINVVIAAGGGAIVDRKNRDLLLKSSVVVCLEAKPEVIYQRLHCNSLYSSNQVVRPLLDSDDPLQSITKLKSTRQKYYAIADWTIHTDNLSLEDVSNEVLRGWEYINHHRVDTTQIINANLACYVETLSRNYPVYIGWGLLEKLGEKLKLAGLSGNATIISDRSVFSMYGDRAIKALEASGFIVNYYTVPAGEISKNIDQVVNIYDFLIKHHVERNDVIIALGGGMVGDLAGFVAATFLRGLPLVHVPTSLVAMSDASIGGKVAVNHHMGKNLIGAFYQPWLILTDPQTLTTLPRRELVSGWAEVIKHGLILDPDLLVFLEENYDSLIKLVPDIITKAISWSVKVKAQVVRQDEKETGLRAILNYGHTIGHGIEAAGKYKKLLHGEAVAIGMLGAAKLSYRLGYMPYNRVDRHEKILRQYSLPTGCSGLNSNDILTAMELDKKKRDRTIHWILLKDTGKAFVKNNVPEDQVRRILDEVIVS